MAKTTYVDLATGYGDIVIALYDDAAPLTVRNFLGYAGAAAGSGYLGSFFHRLVPGFILQGGGFSDTGGTINAIPAGPPVANEFSAARSNLAGTVAMAKLGGDPNSATNQFFFNLGDNSANLDAQNGGFTVFGAVTADTYANVQRIAALKTVNAGGTFSALPVQGTVGSAVTLANLVDVRDVTITAAPPPTGAFAFTDTAAGVSATTAGEAYAGPVAGLARQFIWPSAHNAAIASTTANVFLHGGAGDEDRAFQRIGPLARALQGDGGQQPVAGRHRARSGVQQREAARAIGRLDHARTEAALPGQRRLLVPRHRAHGDCGAQVRRVRRAEQARRVPHLRQNGGRDAEQVEHRRVPRAGVQIQQQGAGRVGGVRRVHGAARQAPQQPRIDSAEGQPPGHRRRPRARHLVQQPGQLGGREIRIEPQPRPCLHQRAMPGGLQRRAGRGGAAVLPDDGGMDRAPGRAVPQQGGLALVGDADGRDLVRLHPGPAQRLARRGQGGAPQVVGVVLHPAGPREVLGHLRRRLRQGPQVRPVQDGAGRRGALVQGKDVGGHAVSMQEGSGPTRAGAGPAGGQARLGGVAGQLLISAS